MSTGNRIKATSIAQLINSHIQLNTTLRLSLFVPSSSSSSSSCCCHLFVLFYLNIIHLFVVLCITYYTLYLSIENRHNKMRNNINVNATNKCLLRLMRSRKNRPTEILSGVKIEQNDWIHFVMISHWKSITHHSFICGNFLSSTRKKPYPISNGDNIRTWSFSLVFHLLIN